MNTMLEIGGATVVVAVHLLSTPGTPPGRFRLTIGTKGADGEVETQTVDVDARPTDQGLSIVYLSDGRVVDAAVTPRDRGRVLVQLPAVDIDVGVDRRRHSRPGTGSGSAGTGEHRIHAPMPGRVLRVLVAPGDEVQARQGLVVVEAMKMENELSAPRGGQVREVHVVEGVSVEAGRLLVIID